ncbi:hypothetical protein KEM56_001054 [Ascosphaera pollenicola]|nr:hypothetical protein KEM56_001054 [Ascosphaera pollenicola]
MAGHPFDTVNFPGMVGITPPPPPMIHHQPSGEAIELGPGSNTERTETVSPSMLSSATSHQQEKCQCSDEIVTFLHERKGVNAEPEASVERLLKVGEEAAQFLSKVVGCRRSNHRAYSNFFGLLMLVDQTLRIYQKLNASAEAALPGSSQSTVVGNMFTTDAANSVSGFGRDHLSMNDALNSPFSYSQYATGCGGAGALVDDDFDDDDDALVVVVAFDVFNGGGGGGDVVVVVVAAVVMMTGAGEETISPSSLPRRAAAEGGTDAEAGEVARLSLSSSLSVSVSCCSLARAAAAAAAAPNMRQAIYAAVAVAVAGAAGAVAGHRISVRESVLAVCMLAGGLAVEMQMETKTKTG